MLTVITGPMFGGKTSKLFEILDEYHEAGMESLLFKPANDSRYSDLYVSTHDGRKRFAHKIAQEEPATILKRASEYARLAPDPKGGFKPPEVFGIDEAQFFSADLIFVVEEMLYRAGTMFSTQPHIVISGLSQDSDGVPFGAMPHLLAIADDIIHCKAVCSETKVRRGATRTFRKDKSKKGQVVVGGKDIYEPRSFESWLRSSRNT